MKQKWQFFLVLGGLFAGFNFFSCDLETPERISIKTSGTNYEFPLGSGSFLIRDKMSASELRKNFSENLSEGSEEIKVYDYNPTQRDDDVLQYLIKYPIKEVSLGLSADGTNDMNFSTKIEISNLNENIGQALTIEEKSYTIIETGIESVIPENKGIPFNITAPTFSRIKLSAGSFKISVNPEGTVSEDFELNARVILCDGSGNEIASSEERNIASGTGNSPLVLDLSGKILQPEMRFKLSGTMRGGTAGTVHSFKVSMQADSFKIQQVTGLTMTAEEIGDLDSNPETPDGCVSFESDFDFSGVNDYLISAEIGSGKMNVFSTIPEGWSGITAGIEKINVSQGEGFKVSENEFSDETLSAEESTKYLFNKTAVLENQTIKPSNVAGNVKVSGQVSVSFENATLVFDEATANPEVEIGGSCKIDKIKSLKVNISALSEASDLTGEVDTGLNFSNLLKDNLGDASDLIKNIKFSGVEGYVFAIQPGIEVFNGVNYSNCKLEAVYETDGISKTSELVNGSLGLKETQIDLDALADENYMITDSSILSPENENYSVKTKDSAVCDLLNDMPDSLKIKYELSGFSNATNELELTGEDFEKLTELKSVQIFILLKVPLQFTLTDKFDFPLDSHVADDYVTVSDVRSLINTINGNGDTFNETEDLLKRDSEEDFKDVKKYFDLVDSVSIYYKATNSTQLEISGSIKDDSNLIEEKTLSFKQSEPSAEFKKLELTGEEIKNVFDHYPFTPKIPVKIKAGGGEIPRNAEFGMSGYVQIKLSGQVEIWNKNEKEEN
ncbi:MAG: hypothetical protein PUD00_00950 [Treponema berlinense]|uniref:hypothetical protein n=1 Tax=Treponema berlinense TaxID=225004 RepID=UPI0023F0C850|nr:hypothetical protein [Treponema berlinense]MDD5833786.1 hypothetical protein [Treponema berlinense]